MSTNNTIGIIYIIVAMATFSVHDSILKFIFQKVSLYEIYFGRTFIAATISAVFLLIYKMMQALNGSLVALITPMLENGGIDFSSLGKLIDWHINEGTNLSLIHISEPTRR